MSKLSPRQREIANLIADGLSITEISVKLGTSVSTVTLQLMHCRRKKGLKTNGQLSAYIWRKRLSAEKKTYNNDCISAT